MHENYADIKSRINEAPQWYDSNGTPRYAKFHPELCPNIYASRVGLFLITCQDCVEEFRVEMHSNYFSDRVAVPPTKWHYGDPPIHGCAGDSMNCDDRRVLEFWIKDEAHEWKMLGEFTNTVMD